METSKETLKETAIKAVAPEQVEKLASVLKNKREIHPPTAENERNKLFTVQLIQHRTIVYMGDKTKEEFHPINPNILSNIFCIFSKDKEINANTKLHSLYKEEEATVTDSITTSAELKIYKILAIIDAKDIDNTNLVQDLLLNTSNPAQ